jgi:hypothetical protein
MSRAIRIRVSETVSRVVHVNDGLSAPVELLPVLPAERMQQALKAALDQCGWKVEGDKASLDLGDGVTAEVDVVDGKVTLRAEHEESVTEHVEHEAWGDTDYGPEGKQQAKAREAARAEGEARIAKREEERRAAVTALLESKLPALKELKNKFENRANLEALKEKARSMGQVEAVHEAEDGNSMSIRIKV